MSSNYEQLLQQISFSVATSEEDGGLSTVNIDSLIEQRLNEHESKSDDSDSDSVNFAEEKRRRKSDKEDEDGEDYCWSFLDNRPEFNWSHEELYRDESSEGDSPAASPDLQEEDNDETMLLPTTTTNGNSASPQTPSQPCATEGSSSSSLSAAATSSSSCAVVPTDALEMEILDIEKWNIMEQGYFSRFLNAMCKLKSLSANSLSRLRQNIATAYSSYDVHILSNTKAVKSLQIIDTVVSFFCSEVSKKKISQLDENQQSTLLVRFNDFCNLHSSENIKPTIVTFNPISLPSRETASLLHVSLSNSQDGVKIYEIIGNGLKELIKSITHRKKHRLVLPNPNKKLFSMVHVFSNYINEENQINKEIINCLLSSKQDSSGASAQQEKIKELLERKRALLEKRMKWLNHMQAITARQISQIQPK